MKSKAVRILTSSSMCTCALPESLSVPIFITNGLYHQKTINLVEKGDYVFNQQGKPVLVTNVKILGKQDVYEVELTDGRKICCGGGHIWTYRSRYGNGSVVWRHATTEELMYRNENKYYSAGRYAADVKYVIPMNKPVQWSEVECRFAPYVAGHMTGCQALSNSCDTMIEYNYKYGSVEQRWQFIRGLFDTNGKIGVYNSRYAVTFSTTSEKLVLDLQCVLHSLGISSSFNRFDYKRKTKKSVYKLRVFINNADKEKLFTNETKLALAHDAAKFELTKVRIKKYGETIGIRDIRKLGYSENMISLKVDDSIGLFQAGDFVVTHA